ncbi:MAG TPA: protein kinase [Gemmatimonadaceae bacterium]|jgi:serine/threonine-protein kinase
MTADSRVEHLQAILGGAYSIERELGGGGMSRVFLARETSLGRPVVLKMLSTELAATVSAERFAREVKLAARLQQANIVPLLSTGDAGGIPWYSMPYVRGESLRARLASNHPVSVIEATNVLRDVARALAFAHGEGVVHRDIKPENILLSGGAAVVTDFGIAKAVSLSRTDDGSAAITMTQAGASIGTPAYMAPEQAAGDPTTDHRADIYAWGVVAWEMIAGRHPFASRTTAPAMIAAHMTETPAALVTAPPGLASLVARCLEKDPLRRPQSAGELLAALDQIGTPAGERQVGERRARSRKLAIALSGAAIVALGTFAAWRYVQRSSSGTGVSDKSLAVLPFESVGGDTANTYFAEGIADELTTTLAKVAGLRLAATSSSFSYRGTAADVREVGRALHVSTVLQGRVRREGSRMRISAQLSGTSDGTILWSNSYEREVRDVFAVQDDITREIVGALRVTLAATGVPNQSSARQDTTNVETYDLYLRGLALLSQRREGIPRSIAYFRDALRHDSTFARAWARLGEAYCVLPLFSPASIDSALVMGRAAVANAQRLDASNADAWAAAGFCDVLALQDDRSRAAFERALSLDPTNEVANRAYWVPLAALGRLEDAVAQVRRTMRVDPLSSTTTWIAANVLYMSNHRDEALTTARRAFELDSSAASPARQMYALLLYASGRSDSARVLLRGGTTAVPQAAPWVGYLIGATGDRVASNSYIRRFELERGKNAFANVTQAWTYLGAGDTTRALDALERAVRAREPLSFSVPFAMPMYDPIRASARFASIIKRYGLDPATFHAGPHVAK